MEPWLLTLGLLIVCSLSAFGIGADWQRERLLKQFRDQRRQNVGQGAWFPNRGDHV